MIFKRLFRKAPQPAAPDPHSLAEPALTKAALNDTDAAAQRAACRRIDDLDVLRQVAEQAADAGTRDLAAARYRHLLCRMESGAARLEQAIAEIPAIKDVDQLGEIALAARAPELRLVAIAQLPADAPVLARCAIEDALPGHRQQAVERIGARHLLEQVVRHIGKKDTKVYRLAREKLRALVQQEERPGRARQRHDELCAQLERLGRFNNWIQDRARLKLIDQQWAEIQADLDPPEHARFQTLRAAFIAEFERQSRVAASRNRAQPDGTADLPLARELVGRLQSLVHETDPDRLDAELADIGDAWSRIDHAQPLAARDSTGATDSMRTAGEQALALALARQRQLREQSPDRDPTDQDAPAAQESDQQGETRPSAEVERRLAKQRRHAERKLEAAPEQLDQLAAHLDAGELRKAEPLYQKLAAALDQARAAKLPRPDINRIDKALKRHQTRLRELQRWRRWSADQGRESLCHEAETLAARATSDSGDAPLDALAARLDQLRRDWRRIDQSGTPASESYWQRFKQATDQVAARCEPYFLARAERQRASREARRLLCEKLEHFLAAVDWNSVDWKAMVRAEREMRQAWNALEPPEDGARGGLEGRFRRGLAQVDKALKEERARNRAHKGHLIERMRALAEMADLDSAIGQAKSLQKQWHTTVAGRKQEENNLWREFRAASDAVFSRRNEERAARSQEFHHNLARCEALCDQLEALMASDHAKSESLARELEQLSRQWRDSLALPLPRPDRKRLEQRWNKAEQHAEQRVRTLRDQADWEALETLGQKSDFLSRWANAILEGTVSATVAELKGQWSALDTPSPPNRAKHRHKDQDPPSRRHAQPGSPSGADQESRQASRSGADQEPPPEPRCKASPPTKPEAHPEAHRTLDQRLEMLLQCLQEPAARDRLREQCESARRAREPLCLRLEILTGLDSPPELKARRMELQVARLQEKLGEGDSHSDPLAQSRPLLIDWYLSTPAAKDARLEARFARIHAALSPA